MENSIIQELNAEADRTVPILIFKNPKLKRKNPKLNGNPKNIIISITALSTLKNLNNIYYDDTRMYVKNKSISMFNVNFFIFFSVVICLLIFTNHASFCDKICL